MRAAAPSARPRRARARSAPASGPTSATSCTAEVWKSIASSRCATACGWRGADPVEQSGDHALRLLLVAMVAGQRSESQEAVRGGGVARGDRVVVDVLAARDQLLVVGGGGEEAAVLGVGEALDHRVRGRAGGVEPARLEGRLVERQQRLDQKGVVLQIGIQLRLAAVEGAQQPAIGSRASRRARTRRRCAPRRGSPAGRARRRRRRARRSRARSRRGRACRRGRARHARARAS